MEPKKYIGKLTDDAVMSCSRLPALMGLSGFSSPNDELRKSLNAVGLKMSADTPAFYSEAASWGNEMEGLILRRLAGRLELKCQLEVTERVEHPTLPLQGSLDGILFGEGQRIHHDPSKGIYVVGADSIVLEGKGVAEAKLTSAMPSDEPAPYRGPLQVQGLMMCTGWKWAAIATLYRGTEMRIYLLSPDAAVQDKIAADVIDFQNRIDLFKKDGVTDWYPAMTANDAASTWRVGEDDLPPVTIEGENAEVARELIETRNAIKSLEKLADTLQAQIMEAIGNHTSAFVKYKDDVIAEIRWGMTPARKEYVVQARPASRAKTLRIKELAHG